MGEMGPRPSVASLLLVPEPQHIDQIVGWLMAVQGDIAGIPERNHQLAKLRNLRVRPADVGGCFQPQELLLNGLAGAPGRFRSLAGEELPASLQACQGAFGDDYSWHSGTVLSLSVPQVLNQARASWPDRCRPVS